MTTEVEPRELIPVFLKPDALRGRYACVEADAASDFFECMRIAIRDVAATHEGKWLLPTTAEAVVHSNYHIFEEAEEEDWYTLKFIDVEGCQDRFGRLQGEYASFGAASVPVATIFLDALAAVGFHVIVDRTITMDWHDYDCIYAKWDMPVDKKKMTAYLVGSQIRILLISGNQHNSALQILKEYFRRILRYHSREYNALQNYVHVSDPGAPEVSFLCERAAGVS
jgi:hypothetical protein